MQDSESLRTYFRLYDDKKGDDLARIVGGTKTTTEMWPWIAWVVIYKTNGAAEQCGGTFIADDWILTAHHCVRNYREIKAYAGMDSIDISGTNLNSISV